MRTLLAGLTAADIRTDPFPHIVADLPVEPELYEALSASFPSFQRLAWDCPPERVPNNRRFALPAQLLMEAPDLPECWKEFLALHSGPTFLAEVAALFAGHWDPAMLAVLDGSLTNHSTGRLSLSNPGPYRIHQDARLEINSAVRDRPSSSRGAHLDTPNRLFSCLFYLRAPDDDAVGGDLELFRWRSGPAGPVSSYEVPPDTVDRVATIPYAANRMVIFPQNVNALHGVSPRHPTPHTRRYVFITAELTEDWMTFPESDPTSAPAGPGAAPKEAAPCAC
ncbi:2OG-Fe(II) oxygenase [Nitrospirillum iridis]|uniref:Prolyl 4-hydroxylase alpha subunit Fe(2+) 2OG dioxygenase domain-containing protein n=1 Tax=Nitrospirillum iridis TaxID=765888 RepID=A0A7X0B1L5_9PROT|nr:2OG-Fe(II) oxygenase [Nitrospirillum iridis]MBB6253682.1 hypothetical protein [Nitrospirillum iridis]